MTGVQTCALPISKEFYDIYKQWCEDNVCHSVSAIRFSAELRQNDRRYNLEATNNIYLPGGRRVLLFFPCPAEGYYLLMDDGMEEIIPAWT